MRAVFKLWQADSLGGDITSLWIFGAVGALFIVAAACDWDFAFAKGKLGRMCKTWGRKNVRIYLASVGALIVIGCVGIAWTGGPLI